LVNLLVLPDSKSLTVQRFVVVIPVFVVRSTHIQPFEHLEESYMKRFLFVVVCLLVTASLLAACAPAAAGGATIKIASQSPLSGGQSASGVDIKNGAELALSQLSAPLKALGFNVTMAAYDDEANPDKGVANAKQIVADPSVLCVVGHYNSGVQIPSSEVYHTAGLANVSPANTNPKVTDRGYLEVNRIVGRDDIQGAVGAQFALSKGIKSAYVLHDKSTYGQGIATYFKAEAEKQGIKVLGFDGTEEKANFDAILTPILSAKPDMVYFGGMFDQSAVLIKQARQKGFTGMLLSDDGFDSPEAAKIAGQALLDGMGTYYSTVSGPAKIYPGTAKFQTDFKAQYKDDPKPFAAQGYDSMGICLKAIENAVKANGNKVPTRAQVAQAVRDLKDYAGITGTISFNAKGDLLDAKYYIIQVVSPDSTKWNDNTISETLTFAPPQ
jgi:branched-chain amino acid transport system substrate-binding protein